MSLHQKGYREPEALVTDPETLRRYVTMLRVTLQDTIDDYIQNGVRGHPRQLILEDARATLDATKEF